MARHWADKDRTFGLTATETLLLAQLLEAERKSVKALANLWRQQPLKEGETQEERDYEIAFKDGEACALQGVINRMDEIVEQKNEEEKQGEDNRWA